MFTGLIEATGTVAGMEDRAGVKRITISAPALESKLKTGDSISVSGVCLTALDIGAETFDADLAAETVARTSLTQLAPGSVVNLELPTPAGTPLGGHIVQGHVDGAGTLESLEPVHPESGNPAVGRDRTDWLLKVEVPENTRGFIVEKGSIAIEGISLTIAGWDGRIATIAVIPHTFAATNLHALKLGAPLNVEADILMKLAAQRNREPGFELTTDYLIANGF
ncbi:MAG: riboflavin synthase [Acidobacteriaceae bacterium]